MHQDIISKKLVLIEDDEVLVEVYKMILEEAGYVVEVRTDGLSGLDLVGCTEAELVLVDLLLPGINGDVIIRKSLEARPSLKFIVLSNIADHDRYRDLMSLDNVLEVVVKVNLDPGQLVDIIEANIQYSF